MALACCSARMSSARRIRRLLGVGARPPDACMTWHLRLFLYRDCKARTAQPYAVHWFHPLGRRPLPRLPPPAAPAPVRRQTLATEPPLPHFAPTWAPRPLARSGLLPPPLPPHLASLQATRLGPLAGGRLRWHARHAEDVGWQAGSPHATQHIRLRLSPWGQRRRLLLDKRSRGRPCGGPRGASRGGVSVWRRRCRKSSWSARRLARWLSSIVRASSTASRSAAASSHSAAAAFHSIAAAAAYLIRRLLHGCSSCLQPAYWSGA